MTSLGSTSVASRKTCKIQEREFSLLRGNKVAIWNGQVSNSYLAKVSNDSTAHAESMLQRSKEITPNLSTSTIIFDPSLPPDLNQILASAAALSRRSAADLKCHLDEQSLGIIVKAPTPASPLSSAYPLRFRPASRRIFRAA